MSAQPKRKIILKNLKEHNTIWHPQSTLVYKSKKERVVIGRFVDGELIPLDDIAVELCDEWRMKPDESLLENDDEASTHDSKDDDEASSHDSKDDDEAPTHDSKDDDEASSHDSKDDDEASSHDSKDDDEAPTHDSKDDGEASSHDSKDDDEAPTHDSKDDGEDDSSTLSNSINEHITAVQNFCTVIQNRETNLQILLSKSMGRTSELEEKLAAAARERQEIEDELDVLKKKFKAMKSLFS